MAVAEARSEETPYSRHVTSDGWFVLKLEDALAVRNESKGGARPGAGTLHHPVSEPAARDGASAAQETGDGDEAYADWPGDYEPVRLPWPLSGR